MRRRSAGPVPRGKRRVESHSQFCRLQKPLPHPALPADPPGRTPIFRPLRLKCSIFGSLFAHRKFIENPTFQKAPQNLKIRPPSAPMSILRSFLAPFWHRCLQKCMQFSTSLFGVTFFDFLANLAPKVRFWDPFWRPAGSQMAPKTAQVAPK